MNILARTGYCNRQRKSVKAHLGLLDVLVVVLSQVMHDEVGDLAIVLVRQPQLLLGSGSVSLTLGFSLKKIKKYR